MGNTEKIEQIMDVIVIDILDKAKKCYNNYITHDIMSDFNNYLVDNLPLDKWKRKLKSLSTRSPSKSQGKSWIDESKGKSQIENCKEIGSLNYR